jgi:hypothetical protein
VRDRSGTCVCVLEGTAQVGPDADTLQPVEPGKRMVLPSSGDPYITDVAPPHAEGLRAFAEGHRPAAGTPDTTFAPN